MSKIKQFKIDGKDYPLCIETEDGDIDFSVEKSGEYRDAPGGSTLVTSSTDIAENMVMLKDTISVVALQVKEAFIEHKPDEWAVEFNIGFKGKAGIPFVASGEASSALKITAKWHKDDQIS